MPRWRYGFDPRRPLQRDEAQRMRACFGSRRSWVRLPPSRRSNTRACSSTDEHPACTREAAGSNPAGSTRAQLDNYRSSHRSVAQRCRAPGLHPGGRGCDPLRSYERRRVTQRKSIRLIRGRWWFDSTRAYAGVASLAGKAPGSYPGERGSRPRQPTTHARSSTDKSTTLRTWGLGVQIPPGVHDVRWRNRQRGGPLPRDSVGSNPTLTAKTRAGATGSTARSERADRGSNPWPEARSMRVAGPGGPACLISTRGGFDPRARYRTERWQSGRMHSRAT